MKIRTPARIHITLLDLNGSYGRIDGGIGFSIQNPQFILESTQTENGVTVEFDESITDEIIGGIILILIGLKILLEHLGIVAF